MTRGRLRFCIVTTANIADNPRVVKEADALSAAGHAVRVVAHRPTPERSRRDDAVMAGRHWTLDTVPVVRPDLSLSRWAFAGVRQKVAGALFSRGVLSPIIRDFASGRHTLRIAARAAREPADVIVAHHTQALPAAARAARRLGAALAYDFEDYYAGNLVGASDPSAEARRIRAMESAYVPQCRAVLASADGIADLVSRDYAVPRPSVILNTFPLDAVGRETDVRDRATNSPLSCYWFSQTIGPNRGLEAGIRAIAAAAVPVAIHLRGTLVDGFDRELRVQLAGNSMAELHCHPLAPPDELVAISAQHDLGLALEQDDTVNHMHAVSNKLLSYLVAGNAIAATATQGQARIMSEFPDAGMLVPLEVGGPLTDLVRRFANDPSALARAKRAARAAAERQFSWEHDAPRLVAALEAAAR